MRRSLCCVGKTVMHVPVEEGTEDRSSSDFIISRNEEFSKIAVINFFSSQIKNAVICGGGFCAESFEINHANPQFNTFIDM